MPANRAIAAFAVHALTSSGAVLGLFALERAAAGDLRSCFALLGAALVVDALDGPIARAIGVAEALPRFSGVRLDLVVDYLTYCVVPAYIVLETEMLPEPVRGLAGAAIAFSSLFHFADRKSKTDDGFFVGFPAIWNLVVFYFHVLSPPPWLSAAAVGCFVVLTFVPVLWVHPLRAARLRPVTLAVVIAWAVAAASVLLTNTPAGPVETVVFAGTAIYMVMLCLGRTFLPRRPEA
ncbi:MAG: phosphatidylcholine/phosphatidylserine synthase [Hyphomicrobiales bacterium]